MNTNEWLVATRKVAQLPSGYQFVHVRPRAICGDGFSVSIQASRLTYCAPRNDLGPYCKVELGYPSVSDDLIQEYAESPERPIGTVYGQVPVEIVDALLEKHGGIANAGLLNRMDN